MAHPPRNVRAQLSYHGGRFFGWQRQDGFASVQQALEEALQALTGEPAVVHGAGRTDTGVHALRQVASFHVATRLDDDRLRHALNAHLPEGVAVDRLESCRDDFHARFDARSKRYLYLVLTSRFRPPWAEGLAHWTCDALDLAALRAAAADLPGEHDFAPFGNAGSPRRTTVRSVRNARVVARRRSLAIVVEANGFLYNMMRTIAGTLLDIGRGRLPRDAVRRALRGGRREELGPTAPAEGLWLVRVRYGEPTFAGPEPGPHGAPGAFGPRAPADRA